MDIANLKRFLVIADELNLTRASRRLFVTQPSLSRTLAGLEHEVGAPLFERHARSLQLTAAGASFAEDAAGLVDAYDAAIARARTSQLDADRSANVSPLRVGIFYPSAAELTRPILNEFRASNPGIQVLPVDITGRHGELALVTGLVDVAFLWSPIASEDILSLPLFADPCVAVVSTGHRFAHQDTVTVADLADENYTVTRGASARWQAASTLEPWIHRQRGRLTVNTVTEALQTVSRGLAVTVGPSSLSRFAPVGGITYVPLHGPAAPTSLLCLRRGDHRAHVQRFAALGVAVAGALLHIVPGAMAVEPV